MSALTSLLARDRIVLVSKIEEALQHQVLSGGDIETVLLEMSLVAEDVLSAYRAALYDRLPATREETMRASRDAIRSLPRELARRVGVIPLQIEGRMVVVAVVEPLSEAPRAEVVAALGSEISERVVTRPRFAAALAHHYGFELEPRMRRLTDALRRRDPGVIPFVRPPGPSLRPSAPSPPAGYGENPFERPDTLEYPVLPQHSSASGEAPVGISFSERALPAPPDDAEMRSIVIPPASKPILDSLSLPVRMSTVPPSQVSNELARAARGPLDEERVRELLMHATLRDEVLFVLLRFAQQFFDFVGIFSVGKEGARGRMAHGAGLAPELMERLIVPLDGHGLLARAVRDKRVLIGDLGGNDEERAAAALLGRPAGRPGVAVPIVLGTRAVLVLYADRVGEGLSTEDSDAITSLMQPVADALRRIIVEQKALRRSSLPPAPVSQAPEALSASQPLPTLEHSKAVAAEGTPPGGFAASGALLEPAEGLEAVDLDRLSRAPERRKDTHRELAAVAPVPISGSSEVARGRLQGVPRTAPPPPIRESIAPSTAAGRVDGSYHYGSPIGAIAEESTRPVRALPSAPGPIGMHEELAPTASVGAAFAQVKPRRIEVEKPKAPEMEQPAPVEDSGHGKPLRSLDEGRSSAARSSVTSLPSVTAPSVIIDMGDQVGDLVDGLLQAGPNEEPPQILELVKVGEAALPVLLQLFPGPLWFDRHQPHKRRARGRDVSAVARAIVAFGNKAAPYLASKVQSSDADTCFYALQVAAEIPHLDLLDAVARRALDLDEEIRMLAVESLRAYAFLPEYETVLSAFAQLSERPGKDPRRQRLAVEALGELRDRRSLSALLPRLSDTTEAIVQAAHRALALLTCQDFGLAQRKWETWAEQWAAAHRVEWLIESLMHTNEATRARAGEELKRATQQYFGYHPQLPKRDRELAQRKYREWWEREGRSTFRVS